MDANELKFDTAIDVLFEGCVVIKVTNDKTGNRFIFCIIRDNVNNDLFYVKSFRDDVREFYTIGDIRMEHNYFTDNYKKHVFKVRTWGKPTDFWNAVWTRLQRRQAEPWIKLEKIIEL